MLLSVVAMIVGHSVTHHSNKWVVPPVAYEFISVLYVKRANLAFSPQRTMFNAVSTRDMRVMRGKCPLDYAMEYNIPGFVRIYYYLYEHGTMDDLLKVLYNCQHGI